MSNTSQFPTSLNQPEIAQLVADRRRFHQHPELAYKEALTAQVVAERLRSNGCEVKTAVGRTGVLGLLSATKAASRANSVSEPVSETAATRTLLYRADMDALPIVEANDVEYRSQNDGIMHACGHDAHVAIALAVAGRIAAEREELRGNLKLAFQPAEEGGNGALAMIEDGALEDPRVDVAIGLHVWNNFPVGTVGIYAGPMMAAVDEFALTVHGVGGHGALPQQTVDAVVVASHIVTALQTVVSRNVSPLDSAVVTVGTFNAGTAFNIIAGSAQLRGTVRTFNRETYQSIPQMIERVVRGVCEAMGATYNLDYTRQTTPLVNNNEVCELVAECAAEVVGAENVIRDESVRTMGGEDMAYFLDRVPGCYFFLGTRNEERGFIHPHHSPRFDIDESALPLGVEIMTRVIRRYLQ